MNKKTNTMTTDVSKILVDSINELVVHSYNYQEPSNLSNSSIPVDMRNIEVSTEDGNSFNVSIMNANSSS